MPQTLLKGAQISDGSVQRVDLDTVTPGQSVIRKIIAGSGISLTSTGADAGTGDVTINASASALNINFSATMTTATTLVNSGYTKVAYISEDWDIGNCYDAPNSRFTPTVAGRYLITASLQTVAGVNTSLGIAVYKNGTPYYSGTYNGIGSSINAPLPTIACLVDCNGTTDFIEIYCSTSANVNTNPPTNGLKFQGCLVATPTASLLIANGNDNEIQFNSNGTLSSSANLTFDSLTGLLNTGSLTVNDVLILAGTETPLQLTANQDNYLPDELSLATTLRLSSNNSYTTITGLGGGIAGRIVNLINIGSNDINLSNNNTASTSANRFMFGNDQLLVPNGAMMLHYDAILPGWTLLSNTGDDGNVSSFRRQPSYFTDFINTGATLNLPWSGAAISSGSSAISTVNQNLNHPGIVRMQQNTTATANSGYYWMTSANGMRIAGGEIYEIGFFLLNVTTLILRCGFQTSLTSADSTDGAYFEIVNSANIVGKTANNSTRTTSPTIATLTINTWYRCTVEILKDGSGAKFTVYNATTGALVGTQTATGNLPAVGRNNACGVVAVGSTAVASGQLIDLDYQFMKMGTNRPLVR